MKKIALCCAAGMSTSMLVDKMRQHAEKEGIECEIKAFPDSEFEKVIEEYDCVLLGPQVRFKLNDFSKIAEAMDKKVEVIQMMDYGAMRGDKVLKFALDLIGE
ncbi:PTS sugar transporter subunit IIB [Vibrio parahaemolyticus]|nr:PTS sugar transporter subunit IIB [Vibrio parahaemolyticus]